MLVWGVVFSFLFVVAGSTLSAFATARPIFVAGRVGLLLPDLFVGVRLEFVRVGALEVGALVWLLVGLVGLDGNATFRTLSSVTIVAISATALGIVASFVAVVAKHVRVPCFYSQFDFGAVLDIMRAEAFGASEGRWLFNFVGRFLSALMEF